MTQKSTVIFSFEMFLYTRYLQIILCKLRCPEVVFPFLFFNDCELRQQNNVPVFSSPFPLLLFFFSLYKFVTWNTLSGLFLKFWGRTAFFFSFSFPRSFALCVFQNMWVRWPNLFSRWRDFSCCWVPCRWFQSGVHNSPSPCRPHFVRWPLIFICPHYVTCCLSPFWYPKLWGGFCIVEKYGIPVLSILLT